MPWESFQGPYLELCWWGIGELWGLASIQGEAVHVSQVGLGSDQSLALSSCVILCRLGNVPQPPFPTVGGGVAPCVLYARRVRGAVWSSLALQEVFSNACHSGNQLGCLHWAKQMDLGFSFCI